MLSGNKEENITVNDKDGQNTYNVKLSRVRVTIVVMEKL
jgi:hypothetical protein